MPVTLLLFPLIQANPFSMRVSKTLVFSVLLIAVASAMLVHAYVILSFPVTIQVSVKEPTIVTGPTPANGTLFASSNKNFTLSFKNQAGPVNGFVYFTTNESNWNCPCCCNPAPFTMTLAGQVIPPLSYCSSIADRCSLAYTIPSGQSSLVATLTASSNAPIVNFTVNFYLAR